MGFVFWDLRFVRKLGLDIGEKRIGIAVSDPTGTIAKPLTTIERNKLKVEAKKIKCLIEEYEIDEIVAGLPVDLRGKKAIAAQKVDSYLGELENELDMPVTRFDERLTSKIADQMLRASGLKSEKRKKAIDEMAASVILQSYLEKIKNDVIRPEER